MPKITDLPIPKAKQTQLINKGFTTTDELLRMKPLHTFDFSIHTPIGSIKHEQVCAVYGEVISKEMNPRFNKLIIQDDTGSIDVLTFGSGWAMEKIEQGDMVTIGGKVTVKGPFSSFNSPNLIEKGKTNKISLKYSQIKGMSEDYILRCLRLAEQHPIIENLDKELRNTFNLVNSKVFVQCLHHPRSMEDVKKAQRRLFFEELFEFNLKLFAGRDRTSNKVMPAMTTFKHTSDLKGNLPFELTLDQASVLKRISYHLKNGEKLNALVQGDVGSGKTMVGLFSLLMNAENGYQGVLMAPTTVLAQQHYKEAIDLLAPLGYNITFINGKLKAKEKREALESIKTGAAQIVIGTHSAISEDVIYNDLRIVIIDEEHRFGVEQRNSLEKKSSEGAHKISLTATPIPRTMAETLYGDDIKAFSIKTMPSGRREIKTATGSNVTGFKLLREEIKKGHQGYIVCPLIDDNISIYAMSAKTMYKEVQDFFKREDITVGLVHGQMKQSEIDLEIEKFVKNEFDILVSTTIIEVGVNVPNATVMIIESADRFGLSQLHQLRGRVGRSSKQSYCLLITGENITEEGKKKLNVLVKTANGFKIAEEDVALRGTGNLVGLEQTGSSKALEMMMRYPKFSQRVKKEVLNILSDPFRLEHYRYIFDNRE